MWEPGHALDQETIPGRDTGGIRGDGGDRGRMKGSQRGEQGRMRGQTRSWYRYVCLKCGMTRVRMPYHGMLPCACKSEYQAKFIREPEGTLFVWGEQSE